GTLSGIGNVTVTGPLTWTGGTMTGSSHTRARGGIAISDSNTKFLLGGRTLDNIGTATWAGLGVIYAGEGAVWHNPTVSVLDAQSDAAFYWYGGTPPQLVNAGTVRKSAGNGTTTLGGSVAFTNTGTVEVQKGIFQLEGGGSSSGRFTVAG